MQEIGTVISTVDGPSTRKFSFVINKDAVVRRGQFVQLRVQDGFLIGRVSDVLKTNKYFMRPESVKEYENSGSRLEELFPVDNWEYLVAEANSLGVHTGNGFVDSSFPPSPGTRVTEPDGKILSDLFGLDPDGLHIGHIPYHNVEVKLNPTRLLQKHMAILAISGAGKSFLSSVIIEELMKRRPEQGQLAIIVIDAHGEYTSFADDPKYSGRVSVFPISDMQIGLSNITGFQISEFFPNLSYVQIRELVKVMDSLRKKSYSLSDLINAIESNEKMKSATKDVLLSTLVELRMTGLFGIADYPSLEELVRQGHLSVIDLSETTNLQRKQLLVAYLARKLFNARKDGIIPPFLLVIEEAHQFVPETMKKEHAISRGIIQTIAREGRKFHASLCLISQRPIQLSTTVLSQCNTHIILRITNPYDLDHIGKSSEGLNRSVLRQISSLKVGTGIIVGEAVNFPLFVKIRERTSRHSEKGLPLEKAAAEYYSRIIQKRKDAREFI
ncbi:MAG: ATP-binding protein [Candidatus Aenigmatarchaeota archaeon]